MEIHVSSGLIDTHNPMSVVMIILGLFGVALFVAPMLARWLNGR